MITDETPPQDLMMERRQKRALESDGPIMHFRLGPKDLDAKGLVKGEVMLEMMHSTKQSLTRICESIDQQGLWFSMEGFIKAARENGTYGAWSTKKMIVKAIKTVLPELYGSKHWASIHKQIKAEVNRVFGG